MPGSGCSVQVKFSPAAATAYAAKLAFSDDADEGAHSTALTGHASPRRAAAPADPAGADPPTPTPSPADAGPGRES